MENKEFKEKFDTEYDYIVKIPPLKEYIVQLTITSIKKGEPVVCNTGVKISSKGLNI
jgi:hypothetical protein